MEFQRLLDSPMENFSAEEGGAAARLVGSGQCCRVIHMLGPGFTKPQAEDRQKVILRTFHNRWWVSIETETSKLPNFPS